MSTRYLSEREARCFRNQGPDWDLSVPTAIDTPASGIDFSRHRGVLDHALLASTHVSIAGLGGAAGLVQALTHVGIREWTFVDFDRVSITNPATQAHDYADRGKLKCEALAERLVRINPTAHVRTIAKRYQHLSPEEHNDLWSADLVLAMTDSFETQGLMNSDGVAAGRPTLFANCYIGCGAVEVTASFPETIAAGGGCHRCHVKPRYDAYPLACQHIDPMTRTTEHDHAP